MRFLNRTASNSFCFLSSLFGRFVPHCVHSTKNDSEFVRHLKMHGKIMNLDYSTIKKSNCSQTATQTQTQTKLNYVQVSCNKTLLRQMEFIRSLSLRLLFFVDFISRFYLGKICRYDTRKFSSPHHNSLFTNSWLFHIDLQDIVGKIISFVQLEHFNDILSGMYIFNHYHFNFSWIIYQTINFPYTLLLLFFHFFLFHRQVVFICVLCRENESRMLWI